MKSKWNRSQCEDRWSDDAWKTGTAEIKESQDDTTGVERGWFICETTEDMPNQIAVVGMVEDVKTKGGSSYVTQKVRNIAVSYLQ